MVAHQVMPATWAYYGTYRFGWTPALIGISLAMAGTIMALSQVALLPRIVPRLGERRAALLGIAIAGIGYAGYGSATSTWMVLAWLPTWLFGGLVMPSTNALLSHRVAANAQGELQGAVAALFSLSSIVGPPLMTQVFAAATRPDAPVRVPGAAFFTAALLAAVCFSIYWSVARETEESAVPTASAPARAAE
jgi:DHA1 family tetracycline resistance protein-like MFS transporter